MVTWETINLVENSTLKARIGWQGLTKAEYLYEGYAYLITGTDFANGKITWETCHYVDKYRYDQDINIQIANGDILVTKDGTIGKVAIVSGLNKKATLNSGVFVIRPRKNAYDNVYAYYILLSGYFSEFLERLAAGSTINHLYQKDFVSFEFPLPPITEQRAIAAALSDVDSYIAALDWLITKKKAIKKGAVEEMLTGKIRLQGFGGEWMRNRVEDLVEHITTGLNPRQNFNLNTGGTNYYVTIKNFFDGRLYLDDNCDKVDDNALQLINARSDLKTGDILFSSIGRVGDAYLITQTPANWNINESVFSLRAKKHIIVPSFFYHLLRSDVVKKELDSNSTGSTLTSIKQGHLKSVVCFLPAAIQEQSAIATILSDMDTEIDALSAKLKKVRSIKQGMMQELLTGRIRLVNE